ncbi:hypothetical protein OESDEN_06312, partial [Oesophagostomum dentatum]
LDVLPNDFISVLSVILFAHSHLSVATHLTLNIPFQTITFAVYSYLVVDGILQHYPLCEHEEINIFSLTSRFTFSFLLNIFHLGWLKCSQVILNPFGLDDDDYEANSLVEMYQRNLAAILTRPEDIPPKTYGQHSDLLLPHTVGSALLRPSQTSLTGSMARKEIPASGQEIVRPRRQNPI